MSCLLEEPYYQSRGPYGSNVIWWEISQPTFDKHLFIYNYNYIYIYIFCIISRFYFGENSIIGSCKLYGNSLHVVDM